MAGPLDGITDEIAALRRYALVLARNSDAAEELVQDCLAKALAAADTYKPGGDLRAWLFRILHNVYMDSMRRQKVRARVNEAGAEADAPTEPNQPAAVEARQVLAAVSGLPEEQRLAIMMVAVDELPYAEAAARMGVPMGTFMSRLGRAGAALREMVNRPRRPTLRLVAGGR